MTETNPNYVPVDWPDEGACPANCPHAEPHHHVHDEIIFTTPVTKEVVADIVKVLEAESDYCPRCGGQDGNHELLCPMLETATLNSAGDPIKVGDHVHHLADAGQPDRDTGTVTYVGPVEIHGVTVENGCRCKWNGSDDETPHHVDLLTVLL